MGRAVIYYLVLMIAALGIIGYFILDSLNYSHSFSETEMVDVGMSADFPTMELLGYQSELAVLALGEDIQEDQFKDTTYTTLLVDNENHEPVVAYNALRRIYPASTTKLLTALVVCDALYAGEFSLDTEVTLTHDPYISDPAAMKSSLGAGCTITVRNLLYGLLMKSYNDFAVILAEFVGGSEEAFVQMMNNKAYQIGATASHFVNPHGLHDDNHYSTAYDMYLIIREAAKYDIIREIDSYSTFTYSYTDGNGNVWNDSISPTNQFLSGGYSLPSNIKMDTWKTGTTSQAGSCLTMYVDIDGHSYSLFVADAVGPDDLYTKVSTLFNLTK